VAFIAALHDSGESSASESDSLSVARDSSGELNHTRLTLYFGVARDGDSPAH
jgi:hypothetical protein